MESYCNRKFSPLKIFTKTSVILFYFSMVTIYDNTALVQTVSVRETAPSLTSSLNIITRKSLRKLFIRCNRITQDFDLFVLINGEF